MPFHFRQDEQDELGNSETDFGGFKLRRETPENDPNLVLPSKPKLTEIHPAVIQSILSKICLLESARCRQRESAPAAR